mmetsp:Transcript_16665/g.32327  ORF Transcript_16665/g.32327 Transcript_16665/m.32327 type:complete len:216 (+) Transcript_16665:394-1041(+)|eukprot:CAMPEP_0171499106 /NCGR_PEP_ID=MMETSP0958-20121227/8249_1 /TAXON_ID=87120 /ORGANISM="Aurantiochytrium limacinum, Strain ATCCMYA-1381" /LENGTH=215 /DNA_ID=CAMNT_0012033635 /DNA_START=293 /DNA_END=940 /DNA_ORIENTATION=+
MTDALAAKGFHPLQNAWCFWEHRKGGTGSDYGSKMFQLGEFQTVEDFWRFKNNLPQPSEVFFTPQSGHKKFADREIDGFSMFKSGIRPEWEDKANLYGGEFFCRQTMAPAHLDEAWEKLLLGLVGETIDSGDEICGVRVVDKSKGNRPTYRLEMWFRSRDKDVLENLRTQLQKCLGANLLKEYMEHNAAMNTHGAGAPKARPSGPAAGGSNRSLR